MTRGPVEILPDTNTGMQIGRTLMIFQTRPISRKEFNVGEYVQEKNLMGRKNYARERQNAIDNRNMDRIEPRRNQEEFDFDDYIRIVEEEYNRDQRMNNQQMDHDWLQQVQKDKNIIKE